MRPGSCVLFDVHDDVSLHRRLPSVSSLSCSDTCPVREQQNGAQTSDDSDESDDDADEVRELQRMMAAEEAMRGRTKDLTNPRTGPDKWWSIQSGSEVGAARRELGVYRQYP